MLTLFAYNAVMVIVINVCSTLLSILTKGSHILVSSVLQKQLQNNVLWGAGVIKVLLALIYEVSRFAILIYSYYGKLITFAGQGRKAQLST